MIGSSAIIIATGDDVGRAKGKPGDEPRARQNVVFEIGFFFGALGRDRTSVLLEQGVEEPGYVDGLVYVPFRRRGRLEVHAGTQR